MEGDSSTKREPRKATQRVNRQTHVAPPMRAGYIDEDTMKYCVRLTQKAIKLYNDNHKGDEIELVKMLVARPSVGRGAEFAHINFKAKPISADHPDRSAKLFFAEVMILTPRRFQASACVRLDADFVKYCSSCQPSYKILHPRKGFRGDEDCSARQLFRWPDAS